VPGEGARRPRGVAGRRAWRASGNVVILGGGVVGSNAARVALGLGARVTLVDVSLNRLRELDDIFGGRLYTLASNSYNIGRACAMPIW